MEQQDELREHIIAQTVASIPQQFLLDFEKRLRRAYADTYEEMAHEKTLLEEQRLAKLRLSRSFRMDWELIQAAEASGLTCTAKSLAENDWNFAYVTSQSFGLTQSYVPYLGGLPQPAKFRDDLADTARIPRLELDDPAEIYMARQFYGLLAHNPLGRRFVKEHQMLGSLQLCVPYPAMKGWAVEIGIWELIDHYPASATEKESVATRGPAWKEEAKKREGNN